MSMFPLRTSSAYVSHKGGIFDRGYLLLLFVFDIAGRYKTEGVGVRLKFFFCSRAGNSRPDGETSRLHRRFIF